MRWFWLLLAGIWSGVALLYFLGCWLLGQWPWHFWKEALPDMYDGKESYDQWATKMEQARRLQAKEEEDQ